MKKTLLLVALMATGFVASGCTTDNNGHHGWRWHHDRFADGGPRR